MNHNRLFQIILDFIDVYGLPDNAPVSTFDGSKPGWEYVTATIMVPGKGSEAHKISDQLNWVTKSNGITTADIIFDGVRFTVQIQETEEVAA